MSGLSRILRDRQQLINSLQNNPYAYFGFFRGFIVALANDKSDDFSEEQRGKVKIRIPTLHQTAAQTPDADLPWAEVGSMGGGMSDCGSYEPAYIGSKVLVVFEQGHPNYPMVVGTWNAQPLKSTAAVVAGEDVTNPSGSELPLEVTGLEDTKIIWRKSYKGHTLMCEEKAGEEFIRIIDRVGNTIELKSPVDDPTLRRGRGNAIDGGAISPAKLSGESHILLNDISGQSIKMKVDVANPEIILSTPGQIKLGSLAATLTLAAAKLLYNSLRIIVLPLRSHTHSNGNDGNPTGPPIENIPDLAEPAAWETPNILGDL